MCIRDRFSAEKSISLSANIGGKIQNDNENLINGLASKLADLNEESNGQIISAIESLKSDFSDLVDRVTSLQMVVDGGALVGAIAVSYTHLDVYKRQIGRS